MPNRLLVHLTFESSTRLVWFQLALERKRAAKKEKMEAGSSMSDPLGFDRTAPNQELAGAGDDSKQENKASGGDGPEELMQGFAWQPNARVMETYDSLGIPLAVSFLCKDPPGILGVSHGAAGSPCKTCGPRARPPLSCLLLDACMRGQASWCGRQGACCATLL